MPTIIQPSLGTTIMRPSVGTTRLKAQDNINLVAFYPFSEGFGTTIHDFSGNGLNGQSVNSPSWVDGKFGKALNFNGSSQYVRTPLTTAPTGNVTITAWIKANSINDNSIVSYQDSYAGASHDKQIYIDSNGKAVFYVFNGGLRKAIGTTSLVVGKWYFLCGIINSSTGNSIFVNGISENTNAGGTTSPSYSASIFIGAKTLVGDGFSQNDFNGQINEVRIYNKSLSAQQVLDLYNSY